MYDADLADMEIKAQKENFDPDKLTAHQLKQRKKQQAEVQEWVNSSPADSLDYASELRSITKEYKQFAFEYKKERALYSEALNKLISLIYETGLHKDKASFENKLPKLLTTNKAEIAKIYIEQMNTARGNYKGWDKILDAYKAEISAIQSVIKFDLTGEMHQAITNKYERKIL